MMRKDRGGEKDTWNVKEEINLSGRLEEGNRGHKRRWIQRTETTSKTNFARKGDGCNMNFL